VIASANYAADARAHPTFLTLIDLGQPNPAGALTAVIYGTDRAKFGNPEATLPGQRVCVTGFISYFRQRPEMMLSNPSQLSYYPPPSIAELR
jgi:DNA/RNA endonuclease YhcR with UshA esterase domain